MGILSKLSTRLRGSTSSNSAVQSNDSQSFELSTGNDELDELLERTRSDQINVRHRAWSELATTALEEPTVLIPFIEELLSALNRHDEPGVEEIAAVVGLLAEQVPSEFDHHVEQMVSCLDHPNKYVRESITAGLTNLSTTAIPLKPLLTGLETESCYAKEATVVLARIATESPDRLSVDKLSDLRETGARSLTIRIEYLLLLLSSSKNEEKVDIEEFARLRNNDILPSQLVSQFRNQLFKRFLETSTPLGRDTSIDITKTPIGVSVVLRTDVSQDIDVAQLESYLASELGLENPTVSINRV